MSLFVAARELHSAPFPLTRSGPQNSATVHNCICSAPTLYRREIMLSIKHTEHAVVGCPDIYGRGMPNPQGQLHI